MLERIYLRVARRCQPTASANILARGYVCPCSYLSSHCSVSLLPTQHSVVVSALPLVIRDGYKRRVRGFHQLLFLTRTAVFAAGIHNCAQAEQTPYVINQGSAEKRIGC